MTHPINAITEVAKKVTTSFSERIFAPQRKPRSHSENERIEARMALFFLFITWLIFFLPIISGKFVYFLDDLKIIYYPLEIAYAQFQNNWQLPLWHNHFGFGHPLLAWSQLGFFTPLHVLLRFAQISPLNLLQISTIAYFGFGLVGYYFFLKRNLKPLPSALGAIIFTFSGFNIGHLNHVNFYVGTMWLPWLLLSIQVFLKKPSLLRSLPIAIIPALISLSSQPQITLYVFLIALLWGMVLLVQDRQHQIKKISLTLVAGLIAFSLSSLSILPLYEFLPLTERNDDLSITTLYEFSYPPHHALTLIFPYLFGDHDTYWGAKGFQELAAFTGLIPLSLAVLAFSHWPKKFRDLRIFASLLVILGIILALGQYSPLYRVLVENRLLTSLAIPGRFVFFFCTGVSILSALALCDLKTTSLKHKLFAFLTPPTLLVLIAILASQSSARLVGSIISHLSPFSIYLWLLLASLILLALFLRFKTTKKLELALVTLTSLTLIIYAWDYNPRQTRSSLILNHPFTKTLAQTDYPRLYSRTTILTDNATAPRKPSDFITSNFTIHQPITFDDLNHACLTLPLFTESSNGAIFVSIRPSPTTDHTAQHILTAQDIQASPTQEICFQNLLQNDLFLTLSSDQDTQINAYLQDSVNPEAYLVRVANPSTNQINQSQKNRQLVFSFESSQDFDEDSATLARHLNVSANSSSARWIGALSLRPYREFIEVFFANDVDEPFNGDGKHALEANRQLLDLAGVTHLIQTLPDNARDLMSRGNFNQIDTTNLQDTQINLYENPNAYPKAFFVPNAEFIAADDDTRAFMLSSEFNPQNIAPITGSIPPDPNSLINTPTNTSNIDIVNYSNTHITLNTNSDQPGWLIFTDSTTPQWQTFIDNQSAPSFRAYSIFKATYVTAGSHTVEFKYNSPATNLAIQLTQAGLLGLAGLIALAIVRNPDFLHRLRKMIYRPRS